MQDFFYTKITGVNKTFFIKSFTILHNIYHHHHAIIITITTTPTHQCTHAYRQPSASIPLISLSSRLLSQEGEDRQLFFFFCYIFDDFPVLVTVCFFKGIELCYAKFFVDDVFLHLIDFASSDKYHSFSPLSPPEGGVIVVIA